jgi:hypothetical protein
MTPMKARRGIWGKQIEAIGSLLRVCRESTSVGERGEAGRVPTAWRGRRADARAPSCGG